MDDNHNDNPMNLPRPLPLGKLANRCDPHGFDFETTADLEDLHEIIGQARAMEALRFGARIDHHGFNLFVLGPPGIGKRSAVDRFLQHVAATQPKPDDWVYVNNFDTSHKPRALRLPAGRAVHLRRDMAHLVEDLKIAVPAAFESEETRNRLREIEEAFKSKQEEAFNVLEEEAKAAGIALIRTPAGFAFGPVEDGEVMSPEKYQQLPPKERNRIDRVLEHFQERLRGIFRKVPQWAKESRDKVRALNREVALAAVGHLIDTLRERYADRPAVAAYLEAVQADVVENVDAFRSKDEGGNALSANHEQFLRRYQINLIVDNTATEGAPVVHASHPSYLALMGRIEHVAHLGTLSTDFTLIKPGALHAANGGYLVLDAHRLLIQPFAYEALKRALEGREIKIEPIERVLSLMSTVSLEPEPIPLQVKVLLLGERLLYYLLEAYDPDFGELFKVAADFEDSLERNADSDRLYARLIATIGRQHQLRPFDRSAVARIIDHSARLVEDSARLSMHMGRISDTLHEADYLAGQAGRPVITGEDVVAAVAARIRRGDRIRERIYEEILRDTLLVDTAGTAVGQINGLSVIELGDQIFGQPVRITATVRMGEGEIVDIEREVELGGPIHSKGVLILGSFVGSRYLPDRPLSLRASLVFEQSYGLVEGDSASLAELCALLSAIGELPMKQSIALTGSVNQHGRVQPIGGVNEKIEGFYAICAARKEETGHAVVIPQSNVQHLMLRDDVVTGVQAGRFGVYAVTTVDEAMALLTGLPAGERCADGLYPEDTVNRRVEDRLREMAETRIALMEQAKGAHEPADQAHDPPDGPTEDD